LVNLNSHSNFEFEGEIKLITVTYPDLADGDDAACEGVVL